MSAPAFGASAVQGTEAKDSEVLERDVVASDRTIASDPSPVHIAASPLDIHAEISKRAYSLWCERGRPDGSPEEDWYLAEREFQQSLGSPKE